MSVVAIIPARGGSNGLPRKNLLPLGGAPLVGRTIMAAREARLVDAVYVSTEDEEIADVARQFGAEVIHRPADLASDTASSESVLLHALRVLHSLGSATPGVLAMLQCTSPFTEPGDIDGTVELVLRDGAECAFTVTPFHGIVWRNPDVPLTIGGLNRKRRQDQPPHWLETGAVYAMNTQLFLQEENRFCGSAKTFIVPQERALEIDTAWDYQLALAAEEARCARRI